MAKHNEIGTNGELLAVNFLKKLGYHIVETNWRCGKKEIDVIATNEQLLIFIEVKTRRSRRFGYPEEAVTLHKQYFLKSAAEDFCYLHGLALPIRFDVISIQYLAEGQPEIVHFQDAFY